MFLIILKYNKKCNKIKKRNNYDKKWKNLKGEDIQN